MMDKVLVLSATLAQAEELHKVISSGKYPDVEFRYPSTLGQSSPDFLSLFKDCCNVIKEEEITVILSVHPGLELVEAALLKEFPSLVKGPTFESVFVALHHYYAKEIACDGFGNVGKILNIDEFDINIVDGILEETTSTPALLREIYGFEGSFSRKIHSSLSVDIEHLKQVLEERKTQIGELIQKHLDTKRYDKCLDLSFTLEEYVKPGKHTGTLHLVEGCVVEGILVPWAISDIGLYKHKPVVVKHITCPSQLDDITKYNLWAVYREVVQRLMALGFDNNFLHMEVFIGKNEVIRVLNMAPCLSYAQVGLYRYVLLNGDSLLAQINSRLGIMVREPHSTSQRCAMRARICSQVYNMTLGEVMDLKVAKTQEELHLTRTHKDFMIDQDLANEDGVHLGDIQLYESNYKNCLRKMKLICGQVLKSWVSDNYVTKCSDLP